MTQIDKSGNDTSPNIIKSDELVNENPPNIIKSDELCNENPPNIIKSDELCNENPPNIIKSDELCNENPPNIIKSDELVDDKSPNPIKIEELVIPGGGVKGIAYLGVIYELQKLKLLDNLKTISCVSIGSLIAIILALGYDLHDFVDYIFDYDISLIKDIDFIGFVKRKSLLKGQGFREFITKILKFNNSDYSKMTLSQLYEKSSIKVIVAVSCVNTMSLEYISYINYPDITLFNLISMSCAIPGILPPIEMDSKYYVDGAVLDNTPINILSKNAWGIRQIHNKNYNVKITNIFDFFSTVIHMKYMSQAEHDPEKYNNWISVDTTNITATSFSIDIDVKLTLLHNGKEAVRKKFNIS
jgi:hypothetical protein